MMPSSYGGPRIRLHIAWDIPSEDPRTPHQHVLVDGVCQSAVVEGVGAPPEECSARCNLMFAAEPQQVLPGAKRRGGQFRRRGADSLPNHSEIGCPIGTLSSEKQSAGAYSARFAAAAGFAAASTFRLNFGPAAGAAGFGGCFFFGRGFFVFGFDVFGFGFDAAFFFGPFEFFAAGF